MSDQTNESGASASPNPPRAPARPGGSRRFVTLFIVYTLGPLIAYQYAIASPAMDWYLFQVARQTAWVLGKIGYSGEVENPRAFAGREAEARKALGVSASAESRPLSAWEAWRYRVLMAGQGVAQAEAAAKSIDELPAAPTLPGSDLAAALEQRVAALRTCLDSTVAPPTPELQEAFVTMARRVSELKNSPQTDPAARDRGQLELTAALEDLRTKAREHLLGLAKMAHVRLQNDRAPLVVFVYDPGTADDRLAIQQKLDKLKALPATTMRAEKIEDLEAQLKASIEAEQANPKKPVQFRFRVAAECSAIPSIIIYLGAVLAFPTTWWIRAIGVAGGLPVLYVVNVLRLACLGVIGAFTEGGAWFKFSHEYIWQGIYIVFVVVVWMAWVEYLVRRRPAS